MAQHLLPATLIPDHEPERLSALRQYDVRSNASEPVFDEFAALAAHALAMPIGLFSVVESKTVVFKANVGLGGVSQVARPQSLCSAAMLIPEPLVFTDLEQESCVLIDPKVAKSAGLRFYAGASVRVAGQHAVGALCVMHHEPQPSFSADELLFLHGLRNLVEKTLELRYRLRNAPQRWAADEQKLTSHLSHIRRMVSFFEEKLAVEASRDELIKAITPWLNSMGFILAHKLELHVG